MSECGKICTRKNSLSGHFSSSVMWITFSALNKHSFQWRRLEDVLKTSFLFVFRRGLQGVLKTSWSRRIYSSWSYILKTPSRRFQDLLKTSSRRLQKCLQNIFKTSWRHFKDVLKDVFNSFLRLTGKMVIYTKLCLGDTSEKFMVRVQYFQWRTL